MSEWKKVKLGDLYTVHNGLSKSKDAFGRGWPFLSYSVVFKNFFLPERLESLVLTTEDERESYSIKVGDVFITRTSETPNELGMSCVALRDYPDATYNGFCKRLRPITNSVYPRYIGFYLRTPAFRRNFEAISGSMITRASLRNEDLLAMEIPLPPLPTQRRIAAVLGALDDKIENSRKICANLEAQAQALFKSWFVDFEPFGGKMPSGWKMGKLGDIAEITMGQSPDGDSLNEDDEGITFFQGRAEFGSRYPTKRLSTTEPKRMAKSGDVLLSVRAPVGDLNIALEDCCIGRGLAAIRSRDGAQSFIYYLLKTKKPEFDLYEGAGTIFGSINKEALHGLSAFSPDAKTLCRFDEVASSLDKMYHEKELESRALAATRDALLSKLMSGEIDVEKVAV